MRKRSTARRYLAALIAPGIVAGVVLLTWPVFKDSPGAIFLLAIAFSSWYGGLRPGLVATIVSLLFVDYLFIAPYFSLEHSERSDLVRMILLVVVGIFLSVLNELLQKERSRAEKSLWVLRASEERYRKLADNFPNGSVITYDRDLRITFIAGRGFQAAGFSPDFFAGKLLDEIAPPEVVAIAEPHFRAAFAGQTEVYECPYPDGRTYFASVAPLLDENGVISEILVISQDITEQKQAEKELLKLAAIVHFSDDAIIGETLEGIITSWNKGAGRIYGYSAEEVVGRPISILIPPNHPNDVETILERVRQGEAVEHFETRRLTKAGQVIDVSLTVSPIKSADGSVIGASAIAREITERKRVQERLSQSESQLAEAQSLANVGSWNWDLESDERIWSDELYRIFGLPRNRPALDLEATLQECIHPDDRNIIKSSIEQLLSTRESRTFSYRIIRPDGAERTIHSVGNVAADSNGNVVRMFGTAQDVTEREEIEKARREAEQKYRDIFENAGEGIFQTTLEGQFIAANPELARIHGFNSPTELINSRRDISREVYVDPNRRDEFKRLLEEIGVVRGFETEIFRQDGSKIWISANARGVRDEQGTILYYEGTTRDITERKRAEEALRQSEVYFRSLIEHTADTISTYDAKGVRLYTSPSIERVLGYKPEEMIGQSGFELLHPDDRPLLASLFAQAVQIPGAKVTKELRCRHKDGTWRILESTGSNLLGNSSVGAVVVNSRDISERRRAEAALRESEGRYRDLVENSHEFICTHDLDGKVISANHGAAQLLGYDLHEFIGHGNIRDILAPEVRHEFEEYMEKVRKDGATSGLMLVQTKSGERRVWEYYNSLRTEGVAAPIVRGVARDITEQRRSEESLQLFRNLIDQSNDAIEVIDPNTLRFIDCNESAYRSLGYSREEFLALTVFDIDPSIDPAIIARQDVEMNESGFVTLESLHLRKDGTTFPVEVNVKLVRLERDYRLAVVRDISGRKRAEKALRESEERYRELFENAMEAIYVHDLSGRYTSLNRAAEKLSGFSRDEIIGKHYSNFVVPRDLRHVRKNFCTKLDEERETAYEIDLLTKDRRRVPIEVVSRLIYENGEPIGVQGTARDITERKRAEEALKMYSRRLMEAQEAERQSLARELHDEIGQVLTAVRINLQSIQRSGGPDLSRSQLDESIAIVDEALGRVRELSIDLRPSLLDDLGLSAALRWYVDRYAQRTGIIAEVVNGFQDDDRLPRELETACFRIAQAALTNVARHAQASSVSVQLERSREKMLLSVIDDGVGFDLDDLRKNALATSALGLRGMEERALAVGGYITIDSGAGRGTRVRAAFPLRRNSQTG